MMTTNNRAPYATQFWVGEVVAIPETLRILFGAIELILPMNSKNSYPHPPPDTEVMTRVISRKFIKDLHMKNSVKKLNDELIMHLRNGIEKMKPNQELTSPKIIGLTPAGKAFWRYKISPTQAGTFIRATVKQNLLPIEDVGRTSSNLRIYRKL